MDISLDCLCHLLGYLGYSDILCLFSVNKQLYKICSNDMTWKYKSWKQYCNVIHTGARLYQVDAAYLQVLVCRRDVS
jgi:hypothetical protein